MELIPHNTIEQANPVDLSPIDIFKLGTRLQKICEQSNGIGISAVQVGMPIQFFLVKFSNSYRFFVNCSYYGVNEDRISKVIEGCLSLPNRFFIIENHRYQKIRVVGKELIIEEEPKLVDIELFFDYAVDGLVAVVFQHEVDHQLGQLGLISNIKNSREIALNKV